MSGTALVTGAAGFIGSQLSERLLASGWEVKGIDCFTEAYPRAVKEQNLAGARKHPRFAFVEADLVTANLEDLVGDLDAVFHLAGQAGVSAHHPVASIQ